MAIPNFPNNLLGGPFARDGNYRIIPDAETMPGSGRASLEKGFPTETQLPLSAGGVAPNRTDFNGILHMLSSFAFWQQSGGQAIYRDSLNYTAPSLVFHDDALWWCVTANGPDTGLGAVAPGTNDKVWRDFLAAMSEAGGSGSFGNPVGTVITYYGVTAPEGYFACDGSSFSATSYPQLRAILGSAVLPDLRGYFVRGYDTRNSVDPDGASRNVGSVQGDAIRNIAGNLGISPKSDQGKPSGPFYNGSPSGKRLDSNMTSVSNRWFDASRVVPTAAENRPKNVCLLYCIKHD